MSQSNRRQFIQLAGLGAAAGAGLLSAGKGAAEPVPAAAASLPFQLGMASYTFREFSMEQALSMTRRLGLKRIGFKDVHLALNSTPAQIEAALAKVKQAGLELYAGGVIYMKTEADVNQAFEYAKTSGMGIIVGVPNHNLLEHVNRKVKEYDIRVAVHNHGPTDKVYPTPESAYERIKNLDRRIGLCIDLGHTQRSGIDPSEAALRFADRLLDVHIKDVSSADSKGATVEIGRGVIDIPKFLRTMIKIKYQGTLALEHEKDPKDPLPGAAESVGYVKGVLSVI
jgi:sugar phosphate isomerase/epimerase